MVEKRVAEKERLVDERLQVRRGQDVLGQERVIGHPANDEPLPPLPEPLCYGAAVAGTVVTGMLVLKL